MQIFLFIKIDFFFENNVCFNSFLVVNKVQTNWFNNWCQSWDPITATNILLCFSLTKCNIDLLQGTSLWIDDLIEVRPTPGHTHSDVSVVVHDTCDGITVVAGEFRTWLKISVIIVYLVEDEVLTVLPLLSAQGTCKSFQVGAY